MDQQVLSLYELNGYVRGVLSETFNGLFWVRAETSDVRVNQNGHCYLEFIEKDANNRNIIARARGSIWANVFRMLKAYFESETGQTFSSGLKVLAQVSVEFHELYGYSLIVHNIDPSYTIGDQARNRAAIVRQLEEEGVLTLNKELELSAIANRIAVISSPTAAGYEDFCNQLDNNTDGYVFYTHLFPAIMQGERTEQSIIAALDKIFKHFHLFDAVVIIRGGGATSELSSFDSYLLAANCAQFPLPIITGIGHERDDTVLDLVANVRAKTPTAVAEFLIKRMQSVYSEIIDIQDSILNLTKLNLQHEQNILDVISSRFAYITKDMTKDRLVFLDSIAIKLVQHFRHKYIQETAFLASSSKQLTYLASAILHQRKNDLASIDQHLRLSSPENILKKGYTLAIKGNEIIKSVKQLHSGEEFTTRFHDGDIAVKAD